MERMSGIDPMFIYSDTPETPMEIAYVCVFDPTTAEGGYTFGASPNCSRRGFRRCLRSGAASFRSRWASTIRAGWMIPSSTSTTTCTGPRSRPPGETPSSPRSSPR